MREDYILHFCRLQTGFLQTVQNFIFGGVIEEGFDDNDPLAAHNRPGAMNPGAQEVKILRDSRRFGMPNFFGGRSPSRSTGRTWRSPSSALGTRWGRNAEPEERPGPIRSGGRLGCREVF